MMRPDERIPSCLPEKSQKPRREKGSRGQWGLYGTSQAQPAQRNCLVHQGSTRTHMRTQEVSWLGPRLPGTPLTLLLVLRGHLPVSESQHCTKHEERQKWFGKVNKKCIIQGACLPEGPLMEEMR